MTGAGHERPHGWLLLGWVGVAVLAHILVALFVVLNRWLQVEPTPPLPALRLALLVSLLALASLMLLHGSIVLVRLVRQRWRQHNSPLGWGGATPSPDKPAGEPTKLCPISRDSSSSIHLAPDDSSRAAGDAAAGVADSFSPLSAATAEAAAASIPAHRPSSPFLQRGDSTFVRQPGQPPPLRPEMPVRHGLTRHVLNMGAKHPWLVYHGALAITTVTFSLAVVCQVIAPGYVDAELVQLVQMFTVIVVALFQHLLLRHRLPWIIWPSSVAMLGGAAMVMVPTVGRGTADGLSGWRGWLGFGLAVVAMVSAAIYFVSLQAFRHLGFNSLQLQYCCLFFCILALLPLTLPIDGADWSGQFDGWTASSWAVLAMVAVTCVLSNFCLQHATWQLGAPTLSMFYGLRLVASIVLSELLLWYTVITSAVQIVGVVVVVAAVAKAAKAEAAAAVVAAAEDDCAAKAAAGALAAAEEGGRPTDDSAHHGPRGTLSPRLGSNTE